MDATAKAMNDLANPFRKGDRVRDRVERQWVGTVDRSYPTWREHQAMWPVRWDVSGAVVEVEEDELEILLDN